MTSSPEYGAHLESLRIHRRLVPTVSLGIAGSILAYIGCMNHPSQKLPDQKTEPDIMKKPEWSINYSRNEGILFTVNGETFSVRSEEIDKYLQYATVGCPEKGEEITSVPVDIGMWKCTPYMKNTEVDRIATVMTLHSGSIIEEEIKYTPSDMIGECCLTVRFVRKDMLLANAQVSK